MKIGLIIPCTSKNREWSFMKETYFYNLTFKTFLSTYSPEHEYVFYVGIDHTDHLFNNLAEQAEIQKFTRVFKNITIKFIVLHVKKGHLTKMWNQLFTCAYDEGCEYFYQCGDDIEFTTKGWVNDSINELQKNNNIGITGPVNNNHFILTQAFVSRTHMQIFGYFFPENIINWGCDDWYNHVYKPDYFYPLKQHYCSNMGGKPRYNVDNNPSFWSNYSANVKEIRTKTKDQAIEDRAKIKLFIQSMNPK
jgi:hypothetical protein